jgi:hypothetical protein
MTDEAAGMWKPAGPHPAPKGLCLSRAVGCLGVRHFENNILNEAGSAEIDVYFWNDRRPGSMDLR